MTLQALFEQNGGPGFEVKSMATGKVWRVDMATSRGSFLLVREDKEALVSGSADRYEAVPSVPTREDEIRASLALLDTKEQELVDAIDQLEQDKQALEEELYTIVG